MNIGLTITDTTINILRTIINPTESKQVKLLTDFVQITGIAMKFYGYNVGVPLLFASNAVEVAYKLYQKEGKIDDYVELGLSIIKPVATTVVISPLIFKAPLLVSSLLTLYHFSIVFENGKELYSEWYDSQIMDNSAIEQTASDDDISLSGKMNITHQDEL
ncbi:MAG: hypothetical protein HRU36_04575 [Rickettsiales bacterium]|nr:hypothetical protein [Rickettsiales bacterium]